jgi:type I site-specific deoxyribonuclease, HsdR family
LISFPFGEKLLSQVPALAQLINLGYRYLPPEKAQAARGGKTSSLLLEEILRTKLKEINRIRYRGSEYRFSEENIQSAIQRLKNVKFDGLQRANELVYDLLSLGISLEQSVDGSMKSFPFRYVDWKEPRANAFHIAAEFPVARERSDESARPDIVLFVNGIPFAVIECKAPGEELGQAISQMIRNQGEDYVPRLFAYVQLVVAVNKNEASYATAGTPAKFWSIWKEKDEREAEVLGSIRPRLDQSAMDELFSKPFSHARPWFESLEADSGRLPTAQDRAIFQLLRPERILELAYKFTVFEDGIKKVARYQQYFVVKSALERAKSFDSEGRRRGGIVWHTQGSGKSLTQVMLARNLALDPGLRTPRIVVVTDREDLDSQLGNTFAACGLAPARATSGRQLLSLISSERAALVTTLIQKFSKALAAKDFSDDSPDVFLLVDEGHRTNYGSFAASMRAVFPRACYLGFTGTPLLKKEKNSFAKFGGLIDPSYSIRQAVEDGAVVPILYEGRLVDMHQDKEAIDLWFERQTQELSKEQKADLKKKYARADMLQKADRVVYMRAFDISRHFADTWKGTPFKGQLVAPSKLVALQYKKYLDEFGEVSSEVVISPPDEREGYEESESPPDDEVARFWDKMMKRWGDESRYAKGIVNQFKYGDEPEIIIVVDKLLTGFDAPRNVVLYLCRVLREHTLLQAIARVNRLYEGKDYGYVVDYAGALGELDAALKMYGAFEQYDEGDLLGAVQALDEELANLPQRRSELWDLFKTISNGADEEEYERFLADDDRRRDFYARLTAYLKSLAIALSSERFIVGESRERVAEYKADARRFQALRLAVQRRYAETVSYKDYESRIKKLLDTHIRADSVTSLNRPTDILAASSSWEVKDADERYTTDAARADMIAHETKKAIHIKMEEDPALYQKFSIMIQEVIDDFRARRISELEYLRRAEDLAEAVAARRRDDAPEGLVGKEDELAYYGVALSLFSGSRRDGDSARSCAIEAAVAAADSIRRHWKVHFWDDLDAQKLVANDLDDFIFDIAKAKYGIDLDGKTMDDFIENVLAVARRRLS